MYVYVEANPKSIEMVPTGVFVSNTASSCGSGAYPIELPPDEVAQPVVLVKLPAEIR